MRILALLGCLAGACCSSSEDPPGGETHDEEFRRCAVLDASGSESFERGRYRYERDGHELDVQGPKDGVAVIGALAGLEDASPASLSSLRRLLVRMKESSVEAIAVAGGIGTDQASAAAVLALLGQADVPILLVPGASEPIDAFREALEPARQAAPNLVDMGVTRIARLPDVVVLSLPGGPRAHELLAGEEGCGLTTEDIAAFGTLVEERPGALVVSATPPRQRGPAAIDLGRAGVSAGDPALAHALRKAHFGVFGYVYESGGRGSDARGSKVVPPDAWVADLFLNVGAADALPRARNDGGFGGGMGAIVEIRGNRARHRLLYAGE